MVDEFNFVEESESCYEEEQLNYYRKFHYRRPEGSEEDGYVLYR